jgi:hypothetical protein
MSTLRYHAGAARALGVGAEVELRHLAELVECERRLGRRLPASLREWISVFGDLGFCAASQDNEIPLRELGGTVTLRGGEVYDAVPDGYLMLMHENQRCCTWAVKPDAGDDPPVFWADRLNAGPAHWHLVADHFSTFAEARVWGTWHALCGRAGWFAMGGPLGVRERAFLHANYREGPRTTDWPGGTHSHFASGDVYLKVLDGRHSEWTAGSRRRGNPAGLARELWWLLGGSIQAGHGADVEEALRSLRKEPPPYPGEGWEWVFDDDLAGRFANGCWLHSRSDAAVVPPCLDYLLDSFDPLEIEYDPPEGIETHVLARAGQQIYLLTEGHQAEGSRSCWWLHAETEEGLEGLARHVWGWGELARTLEAGTDSGRAVLGRLRG